VLSVGWQHGGYSWLTTGVRPSFLSVRAPHLVVSHGPSLRRVRVVAARLGCRVGDRRTEAFGRARVAEGVG
jgi:hypothetical protein